MLVPRLHAPPPAAMDGLCGGGGDAPEESEQLHDGLLVGDYVERVELHTDELQLFLLLAVPVAAIRLERRAIRADYEDVDGDQCVRIESIHSERRGSVLQVLLLR